MENVKKKVKNKLAEMLFSPIYEKQLEDNLKLSIVMKPNMNLVEYKKGKYGHN